MVLGFNFGTLARPFEIPFACDYLGFKTAGNRNTMQWHPSFTHIHIIHCTTETLSLLNPWATSINSSPEHVSSSTDKGQKCTSTGTANHWYIWAEKEEGPTSLCLTFLVLDQTGFPWGHISWWLLSNPYSICPCKTPPAHLPHFWLSDPTAFSVSRTFNGCPKALPCSDSLSKILPVSLHANFPFLLSYPSSFSLTSYC